MANKYTDKKNILLQLQEVRMLIDNCIKELSNTEIVKKKIDRTPKTVTKQSKLSQSQLDFDLNERNFIKTYAKGLSGPKKFVLLLAKITKGKVSVDIELNDISSKWNKMKSKALMGYEFNVFYPHEAKNQGWIDSKKNGIYHLRHNWMGIFN